MIVAQKSLSTLQERITNARETIFFMNQHASFDHILLIDDAVGSGATMNETARKFKETDSGIQKVIGFGLVGSFKGFDVIREV